jgi:hypothetical protein
MLNKALKLTVLMPLVFALVSCADGGGSNDQSGAGAGNVDMKLDIPVPTEDPAARFTEQPEVQDFPGTLLMPLMTETQSFSEPMTVLFDKEFAVFGTSIYTLEKIYLGTEDNGKFLFFGTNDNIDIESPWKVISVDLKKFVVLGGDKAGEGVTIGYVHYDGVNFKFELLTTYRIDVENQVLKIDEPKEEIRIPVFACPGLIKPFGKGACKAYVAVYNTLATIDFKAMGRIGPQVAGDVISVSVVMDLVKNFFSFEPDVDSIRDQFLVPILKAVRAVNKLPMYKNQDESLYLEQTRYAYSGLLTTSLDSVLKIQKMAPEAFENMSQLALGSALAFLGSEQMGDAVISHKQPEWFRQIVAPIIREVGIAAIDLVLNGSKTPFEARLQRFARMETQVQDAVTRLCKISKTVNENQCYAALNSSLAQ